jgi:glycosyltransferase involved in cell wall biosynthesis
MKIVFLAPFGIRPKGTVIARMLPLAVELQKHGHVVVIVAPPYTNPEDSGITETINGVRLQNILLGPKNKVLAAPLLAWRMFHAALRENPDLVHLFKPKGFGGLTGMLFLILQKMGLSLPSLFLDSDDWEGEGGMNDLHDYSGLEKWFYRFQEKWLIRRVAGVTVASRGLEQLVGETAGSRAKIIYLPNCVRDMSRGDGRSIRQRHGIDLKTPVLLLYTRFFEFTQGKLHRVFDEIRRRVPGVCFLVVGRGRRDEESKLLDYARSTGFSTSLCMAGWVEPGEIPDYLAAGDVAVYPFDDTLVNRCKCPAKLTEIILAGVPVVADRVGQVTEYINSNCSMQLCDPDNGETMAELASLLLLEPGLRRSLGDSGRRYLLDHFSWNQYAAQLNDFYEEYVKR